MNRSWLGLGVLLAALLAALWLARREKSPSSSPSSPPLPPSAVSGVEKMASPGMTSPPAGLRTGQVATVAGPAATSVATGTQRLAGQSQAAALPTVPVFTNLPPATVLENVQRAVRDYGSRFGGNPVGTNLEITRALAGANPGQANFLDADAGLRVNEQGEMIDPWGTPFFFHQLSGTRMEIHSAGPDRRLGTTDDLVTP